MIIIINSPAKTFPNKRAERDTTFAISEIISNRPRNSSNKALASCAKDLALKTGTILIKLPICFNGDMASAMILNKIIIPKSEYAEYLLNENDIVEVINAVGGG